MKEMNRREFLTLTGAAVVALSLAGCGGAPSAPAVPTGKEAKAAGSHQQGLEGKVRGKGG